MRTFIFQSLLIAALALPGPALAQGAQVQADKGAKNTGLNAANRTSHDKYAPPSAKNLAKLYWKMNMFAPTDTDAVDNFLLINECEIYQKFYTDDFEWDKIRSTYSEYLHKNKGKFTDYFEFMIPISLSRYDVEKGTFGFEENSRIFGLRKLQIVENSVYDGICGRTGQIPKYPINVMLTLNRPLPLQDIPVAKDVAQAYLERTSRAYAMLDPDIRLTKYERQAYLRLKVKMKQYSGLERSRSGEVLASFFADLEGMEIYDDEAKTNLLYSSSGPVTTPATTAPAAPLQTQQPPATP